MSFLVLHKFNGHIFPLFLFVSTYKKIHIPLGLIIDVYYLCKPHQVAQVTDKAAWNFKLRLKLEQPRMREIDLSQMQSESSEVPPLSLKVCVRTPSSPTTATKWSVLSSSKSPLRWINPWVLSHRTILKLAMNRPHMTE